MKAATAARLKDVVEKVAELLPAQGPIASFVHHNPLHAFEYLPFEAAVVDAGRRFSCEPFLSLEDYRQYQRSGRIRAQDIEAVIEEDCAGAEPLRLQVRRSLLLRPPPPRAWDHRPDPELWRACKEALPRPPKKVPIRHRDLLLAATGADSDELVHPLLVRVCAAFIDQGLATWPMPRRELGLYGAFLDLYGRPMGPFDSWLKGLAAELRLLRTGKVSAAVSVVDSLDVLGIPEAEWTPFLSATLLALRGFGGILRQAQVRPDRFHLALPATLMDFIAVRLLLERRALRYLAARELGYPGTLALLRGELIPILSAPETSTETIYSLYVLAQRIGADNLAALAAEAHLLDELEQRRLLHQAYERRYVRQILGALLDHHPPLQSDVVPFQAVFCLDEREESIRRHLEEMAPRCQTYGTAGYFGVAMYYRHAHGHKEPLCPAVIQPRHEVAEVAPLGLESATEREHAWRHVLQMLRRRAQRGSHTLFRGTLITGIFGTVSALPLVLRVFFPRLAAGLKRLSQMSWVPTALALEQGGEKHPGFKVEEMAHIVRNLLDETGLAHQLAPTVLIIGHGSSSLNNPHESAHDCGACGGGRGGPNARAFAQMANDPRVRAVLAKRGLEIQEKTVFIGGYHNSCNDTIELYDQEGLDTTSIHRALERAGARSAHERCRRFGSAPLWLTPQMALAHVRARTEDLAQVRPEYGHATNAVCVVGRRARTRGLFLDRRAFLISYDPMTDTEDGAILTRLLSAFIPVCAGINLEYYFARVDPTGYGCGTKLPHNITGLVGVMDGHQSDLRTGLPVQMTDIHEPVRLLVVVDAPASRVRHAVESVPQLSRYVRNRWLYLAAWEEATMALWKKDDFQPFRSEEPALPSILASVEWYRGHREHLAPARIL